MKENIAEQLTITPPKGKKVVGIDVIVRLADEE